MVLISQYRRKVLYGAIRASLEGIFHELAKQKECRIVEGHLLAEHVHRCIESPPKYAVAAVIRFVTGKSALASAWQYGGQVRNLTGEYCWARGSAVSTGGYELEAAKRYIREQEEADQLGRFYPVTAVFETAQLTNLANDQQGWLPAAPYSLLRCLARTARYRTMVTLRSSTTPLVMLLCLISS